MMRWDVSFDRDGNDYCIVVIDNWKGSGLRRTKEIIPPKTWFWKRNKYIKEKIAEEVKGMKFTIEDDYRIY